MASGSFFNTSVKASIFWEALLKKLLRGSSSGAKMDWKKELPDAIKLSHELERFFCMVLAAFWVACPFCSKLVFIFLKLLSIWLDFFNTLSIAGIAARPNSLLSVLKIALIFLLRSPVDNPVNALLMSSKLWVISCGFLLRVIFKSFSVLVAVSVGLLSASNEAVMLLIVS